MDYRISNKLSKPDDWLTNIQPIDVKMKKHFRIKVNSMHISTKTILFCSVFFMNLFSTELPTFLTYNNEEMNEIDSVKYVKALEEWQNLPFNYKEYQVVQIVVPNNKLGAYESHFITIGKVSRNICIEKSESIMDSLKPSQK